MNKYESVVIIKSNLDEAGVKELTAKFEKMINNDGKVEKVDVQGAKKLAYPIKKNEEGIYVVYTYEANTSLIAELERNLRIDDSVLKYMTVNITEK